MNTGVQDVHNLAWKLAAVLHGQADAALLESYQAERQPIGRMITEASLENSLSMGRTARQDGAKLPRAAFLSEQGLIFGAAYESRAMVADGTPAPVLDDPVTQYVPSARPGCRAPHVWLRRDGAAISTVDLFGPRFVLLAGAHGGAWLEAAASLADPSQPPLVVHQIGGNGDLADGDGAWAAAYGVAGDGAVLVRPDGHVAWRSASAVDAPAQVLQAALDAVLGRVA
jgi:hypothetical protein